MSPNWSDTLDQYCQVPVNSHQTSNTLKTFRFLISAAPIFNQKDVEARSRNFCKIPDYKHMLYRAKPSFIFNRELYNSGHFWRHRLPIPSLPPREFFSIMLILCVITESWLHYYNGLLCLGVIGVEAHKVYYLLPTYLPLETFKSQLRTYLFKQSYECH